jgi:hypothetical protein
MRRIPRASVSHLKREKGIVVHEALAEHLTLKGRNRLAHARDSQGVNSRDKRHVNERLHGCGRKQILGTPNSHRRKKSAANRTFECSIFCIFIEDNNMRVPDVEMPY